MVYLMVYCAIVHNLILETGRVLMAAKMQATVHEYYHLTLEAAPAVASSSSSRSTKQQHYHRQRQKFPLDNDKLCGINTTQFATTSKKTH